PAFYLVILAILLLLTVLTVGVSFAPLSGQWHITIGLLIAICKASLVVLFFMHALFSPRVTWLVIAAALLGTIILFGLTLSDDLTGAQGPCRPGHWRAGPWGKESHMLRLPKPKTPPLALDVAGFLLGFVGLLLFFLPILGIPLSACGMAMSLIAVVEA